LSFRLKEGHNQSTTLGESYEEDAEKTDASQLKQRAEDFPLQVVPQGSLILKAGVDVQKDRFEVVVWAFGRGEEMWSVDYQVIEANPALETEWHKLDPYLLRTYPHVSGARLSIEHAALDTGGHWPHEAYNFVRERRQSDGWQRQHPGQLPPRLYATKGSSTPGQKIHGKSSLVDVNQRGKVIKNGLRLYLIGTDTAKDLLFKPADHLLRARLPAPVQTPARRLFRAPDQRSARHQTHTQRPDEPVDLAPRRRPQRVPGLHRDDPILRRQGRPAEKDPERMGSPGSDHPAESERSVRPARRAAWTSIPRRATSRSRPNSSVNPSYLFRNESLPRSIAP
jgi:phage terminase large subunit GpA-like protein